MASASGATDLSDCPCKPPDSPFVSRGQLNLARSEVGRAYEYFAQQLRAHLRQLWLDNPDIDVKATVDDILFRLTLHRRVESVACILAIAAEHILFVPSAADGALELPMTAIRDDEDSICACFLALKEATGATTCPGSFAGWRNPTDDEPDRPVAVAMMTERVNATNLRDEVVIPVGEVPDYILNGRIRDSISIETYCEAVAKRTQRI